MQLMVRLTMSHCYLTRFLAITASHAISSPHFLFCSLVVGMGHVVNKTFIFPELYESVWLVPPHNKC